MGQVDALRMVEHIRKRLTGLAVSENFLRDNVLSEICRTIWSEGGPDGGLVSELWVEGAFSGERSADTLRTLSDEGLFPEDLCRHIAVRGLFPENRPLFNHQSEALRTVVSTSKAARPTLVVTAWTGLGKTEAFLLPILTDLWRDPQRQKDGGMRCLILYPMNALIVDQVDRVYKWLQGQDRITVFHFTSETPEDARQANSLGVDKWDTCRVRTRQQARGVETHSGEPIHQGPRGSVPDIVITNYSMLEYMLCRPQDAPFFGPDLRCIILDEAHLYTGALAAEIAMLLRRVKERCGVAPEKVLQIATSATLEGTQDDLVSFASELFSSDRSRTIVIRGRSARSDFGSKESPPSLIPSAADLAVHAELDFSTLNAREELINNDESTVRKLSEITARIVSADVINQRLRDYPATPARFLFSVLREAPLVRRISEILSIEKGHILSLEELARHLFPKENIQEARNAAIVLLRFAAAARMEGSDLPLVPHRLHFLVRAPEGLSVCLNPQCSGPDYLRVPRVGCLQSTREDKCRYCEHILLPVHRCENCGEWALAAHENQELWLEPGYYARSARERTFYLLVRPHNLNLKEVTVDSSTGEKRGGYGFAGVSLWEAPRESEKSYDQQCPTCHSKWTPSESQEKQPDWNQPCQPLIGGRPFALSVVAETTLNDLPPFPDVSREWKPAQGRRLLCFSDSRASAARLGPLLTRQHEMQVLRAAIARCVRNLLSTSTAEYLAKRVEEIEKEMKKSDIAVGLRRHLETDLADTKWKLCQANEGTSFQDFAAMMTEREEIRQILDRDIADRHNAQTYGQPDWKRNSTAVQAHAEGLVAWELARPLRLRTSVESVGLIQVVYPGLETLELPVGLEEMLPSEKVRGTITAIWPDLVALLLDTVRRDGCLGWSSESSARKWLGESPLDDRWLTRRHSGWSAHAFVGATPRQLRRRFVAKVLNEAGYPERKAEQMSEVLLTAVFDQLFRYAQSDGRFLKWLKYERSHQIGGLREADLAIQIIMDGLSVREPTRLYRCQATGTVWPFSALGWAPIDGCTGTLQEVSPGALNEDARWGRARKEFLESPIFSAGLWAEEHSAQLSPQENRRLQELFKMGIRNILSSTTTMELGIDIGGLNGVLLGNVPPGPANHRQRAGRAGRRADGSTVVVTFARKSKYDGEVFRRFGDFLRRPLRKPTVVLGRDRIIRRHLQAVLLSDFLRAQQPPQVGAMYAFGKMGQFCGVNAVPVPWRQGTSVKPAWEEQQRGLADQFLEFLQSLPMQEAGFRGRLSFLARGTALTNLDHQDRWEEFLKTAIKSYKKAIEEWNDDQNQLRESWDQIPSQPSSNQLSQMRARANAIGYQVRTLCDITVIEWLADYRFLPRYGFPINLQRLTVRKAIEGDRHNYSVPDERYRLERSSLLALSEYVPESRVLIGGQVVVSRGLRRHWTDSNLDRALGLQYFSHECQEGHLYVRQSPSEPCPTCGGMPVQSRQLVFPRFGYTTAGWEPPRRETDPERVGEQTVRAPEFAEAGELKPTENFGAVTGLRVTYKEESVLLVTNAGNDKCGFAICTRCGFAMSEKEDHGKGRMNLPDGFDQHASIFSTNPNSSCWEKGEQAAPVLRNRVLAARELTDMLLIEWPGATEASPDGVYSLGRAMVLAGTQLLELDERELGLEIIPLRAPHRGIVIYDTAAGGAGHCFELLNLGNEWVQRTRQILHGNDEHHSRCRRACLDCILDFSGQYRAHQLDRHEALQIIDSAFSEA
jgi:DEAD/DEAH box helicase domain-containing protein